jgi:SPP1 gp7 family putative phage head morphogenesis protein
MPTLEARAARLRQQLRIHRSVGIAKRPRRRLPRQIPPDAIANDYARALLAFVDRTRVLLRPLLDALPELIASARRERHDAYVERTDAARQRCHWCRGKGHVDERDAKRIDDRVGRCPCVWRWRMDAGEGRRVQQLIDQANETLAAAMEPRAIEELATKFARYTETYQRIQLDRQLHAGLGVDVFQNSSRIAPIIEAHAVENVALIKDIPLRIMRDVEMVTTRAISNGTLWPELAKDIEKRFNYGEDRAKLIARDQVGKLYGQVNAERQRSLGIGKFIWHTVHDDRVREEHEALDGQTFSYDDLPSEGLPGEAINCRCWAEPVLDDILAGLDI